MRTSTHLVALSLLSLVSSTASANVIFPQVTNTNDSGSGSLRRAISDANANGADGAIVTFQIGSTCGPNIIYLQTALPDITAPVHLEGFTQPGASQNTSGLFENNAVVCVVLDGGLHSVADGFTVPASVADSLAFSVEGMAFSGFSHSAVNLRGGSGHAVGGIVVGGKTGGVVLVPSAYGVILAPGVHDASIGGDLQQFVNQFANVTQNAVYVGSSTGSSVAAHKNLIAGNLVGFYYDGSTTVQAPAEGSGMVIGGYNNTIEYNSVFYSVFDGIHVSNTDAHGNTLQNNDVADNGRDGFRVDDDAHDNTMSNNVSFDNTGSGFRIVNGLHNTISRNDTRTNGGLGIDLADAGVTVNDNDSMIPVPDYANGGQNFPVLTYAAGGHSSGTVKGSLTTLPGDYTLEFFASHGCDASGYGQGDEVLYHSGFSGTVTVPNLTAQGQGSVGFTVGVQGFFTGGFTSITATATSSGGNTSEFSACYPYTDDTIFTNGFQPLI